MWLQHSRRAVFAAMAGGALIAASLAACGPTSGSSADATSSAAATSSTTPDGSLDSMPFGSVGGGFTPLPGGPVASVPVGAGQTVTVPVAGQAGVPASGAGAVALAVAASGGAGGGSVTVYPAGASQPDAPSVSWPGGQVASGLAVSGLSGEGAVAVHNASGHQVTVSLDADGYWLAGTPAAAGAFGPLAGGRVARVLVGGGQTVTVPVAGQAGVPASGAGTVALTAAVPSGFGTGSVTIYPAGAGRPGGPSLSWAGGSAASGLVVSALGSRGTVALHNSSFLPVTVTLDADGYWLSGAPAAVGTFGPAGGERVARVLVGAGQTVPVPVAGHAGVPASGAGAAALAVRVAAGRSAGSVTLYPAGASLPDVPSLSWAAHRAASGLAVSALDGDGTVAVHNSSARPVTVTLAAAGYWLSKGRVVSDITAKPTTVTLTGSDVTAVSGDPSATETVTLAAGVPVPAVGRVLAAPVSAAAPDGLLGTVTALAAGAGGTHVVTLTPATLDQAYSTFEVSTSQTLTNTDVVQAPAGPGGQTQSTEAIPMSATLAAAPSASPKPGFGFDISKAAFTCKGSGDSTITLTADLSKINVDLFLNANPSAPVIHFLITADPVFDINVDFTGTVTCELADAHFLQAHILIPATPGLMVDLNPVLTLDAHGDVNIDFQWDPRAALGFDKGPGISSEVHGFGSSGNVTIKATADADLYMGLHADISLAGRAGVGGDFGPDLPASYDSGTGCVTVDGRAKADLTANADIFVKSWTFTLASGTFDERQLFHACGLQTSPSSSSTSSPHPSGPSSSSSSAPPVNAAWTAAQPPLPDDADSTSYSAINDVSCPSATSCLATGYYTDTSGVERGLLLTWLDGAWTAAGQAPYGSNLSCVTASLCVGADGPFIDTWSSGTWTIKSAPVPADNGSNPIGLQSVSCVSASFCVAAGDYTDTSGNTKGLLETFSDGTWTLEKAPLPADAAANPNVFFQTGNGTNLVSCVSASFCVAAGSYADTSGSTKGLLETFSDGTWTVTKAPLPADIAANSDVELLGLSCPTASHCLATGSYYDTSGGFDKLLETWSDGSWSPTTVQAPGLVLGPIACVSASACVIAGSEMLTSSGGSWTAAPLPNPPYGVDWDIDNVSCASASYCVAAGRSTDATNEHWQAAMATGSE